MTSATRRLPPLRRVRWDKTFRLIPSRYPPVDLFEQIADPADWELLAHIEGLTNERLRDERGDITLVPLAERVAGPGATPIMAAFTHVGFPSRFTDGSFGVYYASDCQKAALQEVLHHRAQFFRRTSESKMRFDLRTYIGRIDAKLYDVRGGWSSVHDPASYVHSQALAVQVRARAGNGIVFDSVRSPPAANIAVLRPSVLRAAPKKPHTTQGPHVRVEWDGGRMSRYITIGERTWHSLPPS